MIAVDLAFFSRSSVDPASLHQLLRHALLRRVGVGDAAGCAAAVRAGFAALRQLGRAEHVEAWLEEIEGLLAGGLAPALTLAIAEALALAVRELDLLASLPDVRLAEAAMHRAAEDGRIEDVRRWLDRRVGPNARHPGWPGLPTGLHVAAFHGHAGIVELLLARGAEPRATNVQGRTALHVAADRDHALVVALLAQAGAPLAALDFRGQTARQVAAERGHAVCVRVLSGHVYMDMSA